MIRIRRHNRFIETVLATLAIVAIGRVVRAQDDVVIEDEPAAPIQMEVNVRRVDIVDQWLFGGQHGAVGSTRSKLDLDLKMRIHEIERGCELTEAQKQKLHLAGAADIKRFFDRVDEIKRQWTSYDNNVLNQAVQSLATELRLGLFGDRSFFAKTIKRTLTAEQAAKLESFIHQKNLSRYRAMVGWYVVQLNKSLGLSDLQRQQLVELLLKETRPPKQYSHGMQWFNWFFFLQASSIPESRIKPVFDDIQWAIFSRQFAQAKKMEKWLKTNRVIADDWPANGQPADEY